MTDIGLFSAEYEQLRAQAEMLDEVLIGLKTDHSHPGDPKRKELAELLEAMSLPRSQNFAAKMLMATLHQDITISAKSFATLAQGLRAERVPFKVVQTLGELAQVLEGRRAGTMARLRGWTR